MRYKKWLGMKTEHEDIIFNPKEMFRVYSANEIQGEASIIVFSLKLLTDSTSHA
jgi:hypothetical protein